MSVDEGIEEIKRLAKRHISRGGPGNPAWSDLKYDPAEWCDHGRPALLKLECSDCLRELIEGAKR